MWGAYIKNTGLNSPPKTRTGNTSRCETRIGGSITLSPAIQAPCYSALTHLALNNRVGFLVCVNGHLHPTIATYVNS